MEELIRDFPKQLEQAIQIGREAQVQKAGDIHEILICGMGGSGVGANFIQSFLSDVIDVPIIAHKDYDIPNFVDNNTLAIISSYSGNTEETLSAYRQILAREAKIIVISSGGELSAEAQNKGHDLIALPTGYSAPRACFGFSVVAQLYALEKAGCISNFFEEALIDTEERLQLEQGNIKGKAEQIAGLIEQKIPVLYAAKRSTPTLLRWRQQLNENAKHLCWHNEFPEMNHNEIVGWKGDRSQLLVIALRHRDDPARTQLRIDLTKEVFQHWAGGYMEVFSRGQTFIEKSLYLVHLGDWVSCMLANIKGEDPDEVKVIDHLKTELAKYN
jgi:glucose/mannose-6-phosphate isomerase